MNAGDVMTTHLFAVRGEMPVRSLAEMLVATGISGVPVVDAAGELIGIVSEGDLVRRCEIDTDARRHGEFGLLEGPDEFKRQFIKINAAKVEDVMTKEVITAAEDARLRDVVALMESHRIKRLPILRDGKLAGIVSRADIVRALSNVPAPKAGRGDATLRDTVRSRLDAMSAGSPWFVTVSVRDAVVELWGSVGSDVDKRAIRVAAEATPGVKRVADHLYVTPRIRAAREPGA